MTLPGVILDLRLLLFSRDLILYLEEGVLHDDIENVKTFPFYDSFSQTFKDTSLVILRERDLRKITTVRESNITNV